MTTANITSQFKRIGRRLLPTRPVQVDALDTGTRNAATSHRSFDAMSGILAWLLNLTRGEFADFTLQNRDALELGTGKFMVHAAGLYVCGAKNVTTIDKFRQFDPQALRLSMSRPILARRYLSPHIDHDGYMTRLRALQAADCNLNALKTLGIDYRAPLDMVEATELREQFDFMMSYTTFEHVPPVDIPELLDACCDALRPGGVCVHYVDLEDHRTSFDNPLQFLDANEPWTEEDAFMRGNRLRLSTWRTFMAARTDMDWRLPYIAVRNDAPMPSRISDAIEYQDETDLRTTAFTMIGRKRA